MNLDHDDHTHTTLHELHECLATQRKAMLWQMRVVAVVSLLVIWYWVVR